MRSKLAAGALIAVVAFLLATNPVVVNAAGQIGSADIAKNAVKSKHVKDNSIKSKDIKDNQVRSADIKDGTLTEADLTGATAAAFKSTSYRFRLPVTPASVDKTFNLPVPPGTYLATYNVIAQGDPFRCVLNPDPGALGEAPTLSANDGSFAIATSSAILVTAGSPSLNCFGTAGTSFTLYESGVLSSVSLTRIDVLNTPTATGGKPTAEHSGGAFTN